MGEKSKKKLKCSTFENSSLSENNKVKVVLVLNRIEFNWYYESKYNKTKLKAFF